MHKHPFFTSSFITSSQDFFGLPLFIICPGTLSFLTLLTEFVSSVLSQVPKPSQFDLFQMILYISTPVLSGIP